MAMTNDHYVSEFIETTDGCRIIRKAPTPSVTKDDILRFRKLCEDNLCGNYRTSWTCPPYCGTMDECMDKINSYRYADILVRDFQGYDIENEKEIEEMMDSFRSECRNIKCKLIEKGADVLALADGPCRYCGENCSVKIDKECPFPDKQLPSVSGYGVDMERYIRSLGESFGFSKDRITLYGIFLFK